MTNTHNNGTAHKATGDQPELIAYTVQSRGEDKKAVWTRIGAAWLHKDGNGYDLRCPAFPIDGRLTLRFQGQVNTAQDDSNAPEEPAPETI